MALELKIFSPSDDGYLKSIDWNYEELKQAIAAKTDEYRGLVYTDDQITEAKADKAALNKLYKALEDKRKDVKRQIMAPYKDFEEQIKDVERLVQEPIQMIDSQLKEYDDKLEKEKIAGITEMYQTMGFAPYATLDKVWNPKWVNKSYRYSQIKADLETEKKRIEEDESIIGNFGPELSPMAMTVYRNTLDLKAATDKANEIKEYNKRAAELKAKQEAEAKAKEESAKAEPEPLPKEWQEAADNVEDANVFKPQCEPFERAKKEELKPEKRNKIVFEVVAAEPEFAYLNQFFAELRNHVEDFKIVSKEVI